PHHGVLAEGFERTGIILRGHDEGLLAHVGSDFECGPIGREVDDGGFVAYHSRRTAMSSGVRPRPDCSLASSMTMSHSPIRSLPGSSRALTSLRTRSDPILEGPSETTAIGCFEN